MQLSDINLMKPFFYEIMLINDDLGLLEFTQFYLLKKISKSILNID